MKIIVAKEKFNCDHLLGTFAEESHFDTIIDEDCMFFTPPNCSVVERTNCGKTDCSKCEKGIDEDTIGFVLIKNYFTQEEQDGALEGLRGAAVPSQNRGIAAGPRGEKLQGREWVTEYQLEILDYLSDPVDNLFDVDTIDEIKERHKNPNNVGTRGYVWLTSKIKESNFNFTNWVEEVRKSPKEEQVKEAERVKKMISSTNYAAPVFSGVAGSMGRYPRIDWGRVTAYTKNNPEKFALSFPFLQKLSKAFEEYLPRRYNFQKSCADKVDPAFVVPGTPFSTITVNKSFRTAYHLDAGDLGDGFSNLSVLSDGKKYSGGMLVLPEYRAAINVRPGDLLLIANHTAIHGNTPIVLEEEGAERYSVVAYFREDVLQLGPKEYEDYRFNFIEERRLNKEHPSWRPLWNGISPGWIKSQEWKEYLLKQPNGEKYLKDYHSDLIEEKQISFEDFF